MVLGLTGNIHPPSAEFNARVFVAQASEAAENA
jgi:hypothetical protein